MIGAFVAWSDRPNSPGWVIEENGCWTWVGCLDSLGYPAVRLQRTHLRQVHKLLWVRMHGPIPEHTKLRTTCGARLCVSPHHRRLPGSLPIGEYETGVCACGCGGYTRPAMYSKPSKGWVRGRPKRFIRGHNMRVRQLAVIEEAAKRFMDRRRGSPDEILKQIAGDDLMVWSRLAQAAVRRADEMREAA